VKIEISKVFCSVVAITMAWVVAGRILVGFGITSQCFVKRIRKMTLNRRRFDVY